MAFMEMATEKAFLFNLLQIIKLKIAKTGPKANRHHAHKISVKMLLSAKLALLQNVLETTVCFTLLQIHFWII